MVTQSKTSSNLSCQLVLEQETQETTGIRHPNLLSLSFLSFLTLYFVLLANILKNPQSENKFFYMFSTVQPDGTPEGELSVILADDFFIIVPLAATPLSQYVVYD